MSIRTLLSAGAGLWMAFIAAPASALHAQTSQDSAADRTYRTNVPMYPRTGAAAQARGQVVADSTFAREAKQGNLFEVRAGTLAGLKASNSAVKQFASRMVSDHTKLGDQWSSLGDRLGVKGSAQLDATQQQALTRLQGVATGAEFDRAYMSEMVQDHQKDAAAFAQMAQQAQSPALRQLASSSLTTIQQHLTLAQQVAGQVGAGPVATNVPSPAPPPPRRVTSQGGKVPASELRADKDYIDKVDEAYVTEVRLAEIAQPKLKDGKVKQFSKRLEADLRPRRDRWDALAAEAGLSSRQPLPPEMVERLKSAGPKEVDRVYMNLVTDNLASLISTLENGKNAHAARVRNMASDELPMLRQHQARAKELAQKR